MSGNPLHDLLPGGTQGAVSELMFPDAPSLRRVSLANTGINTLPFDSIARSCRVLEDLDLSSNNFTTVIPGQFNQLQSLRRLSLAGNSITSIKLGAFAGMILDHLDLSSTGITLQSDIFKQATVRHLSIASNNLQTIDASPFMDISQDLTGVDISGNPLTLQERMFKFLPNLRSLSLAGMRLARLPKNFLAYDHKIISLNISNNMFQDLDEETLAALPNLEVGIN